MSSCGLPHWEQLSLTVFAHSLSVKKLHYLVLSGIITFRQIQIKLVSSWALLWMAGNSSEGLERGKKLLERRFGECENFNISFQIFLWKLCQDK